MVGSENDLIHCITLYILDGIPLYHISHMFNKAEFNKRHQNIKTVLPYSSVIYHLGINPIKFGFTTIYIITKAVQ